jgi:GDPmannose 4,6-dehydratase
MLQQEKPRDFVIATGEQLSVKTFLDMSAKELGVTLRFEGEGVNEIAIVDKKVGDMAPSIKVGDTIVRVDPRYFRPTEVETLLGDASRAKRELGWVPEIKVEELCREMVAHDLDEARQMALLKEHGFSVNVNVE